MQEMNQEIYWINELIKVKHIVQQLENQVPGDE